MKKLIGAVLAAVMAVSLLTVTAGAEPNVLDTVKIPLTSGKAKSFILSSADKSETDFKVVLKEKGDLKSILNVNFQLCI